MSRNVTILVIMLIIILIAGYLLWLRGRFQVSQVSENPAPTVEITPTFTPVPTVASPSAAASPSGTKLSPTTKISPTSAGKVVR